MGRLIQLAWVLGLLTACGPTEQAAPEGGQSTRASAAVVRIDGSGTVFPLAEAIAEEYQLAHRGVRVTIGVAGTGGGMKKFCRGELDIVNASRPIQKEEMEVCAKAGIDYYELPIAYDAVTVVVNPRNTWVQALTIEQLRRIWEPSAQGVITRWKQIDPSWPDQPINLYGAGADSGTFDYFTEVVTGKAKSSRGDYTASEDDNVLVQGVANDVNALGYFGFAYYVDHRDKLRSVPLAPTEGAPPVPPSVETVIDGSYMPMSRPVFMYVNAASYQRQEVAAFVSYFLDHAARLAEEVNAVPLPPEAYQIVRGHLTAGRTGTVFKGEPARAVSIRALLAKETGS